MSDRCVFVPYAHEDQTYEWADVVIPPDATPLVICRLARQFMQLPGPHKVFVTTRDDPRFQIFQKYSNTHYFDETEFDYGYSVMEKENEMKHLRTYEVAKKFECSQRTVRRC